MRFFSNFFQILWHIIRNWTLYDKPISQILYFLQTKSALLSGTSSITNDLVVYPITFDLFTEFGFYNISNPKNKRFALPKKMLWVYSTWSIGISIKKDQRSFPGKWQRKPISKHRWLDRFQGGSSQDNGWTMKLCGDSRR